MAAHPGAVSALPDEVKKNLKSIVLELRHLFEADLGLGLKRLGIDAETGKVTPADDPALFYLTAEERETRTSLDAVLAKETAMTKDVPEAVRALLREAAYTHLNRLIGLKCLELRGHLAIDGERTEIVTQRSDYGDLSKYLWTLRSRDARLLGDPELLWREGLVRACTAASVELGVLFDPADPYAQVWPSHKALVQAVRTLEELPESAFRADELLGWVYQYFQSEEKDRVFAKVRTKKKKIAWADIVSVTQLYTERYMVDFLLQNSIGARWMEMYPDSRAKEAWLYYVEPATPHAREPRAVKEWTLLDPCCGSGHFLVVAFDLFVQLYAEERALAEQGLVPADWAVPEAEVARTILERNLHGIDIDPRAVQLSALALYLKAKDLGVEGTPQMHLVIADCILQRGEHYQALLGTYEGDAPAAEAIEAIWSALEHVRDLGSLVLIEEEVEAAVARARKRSAGSFGELADWAAYKAELIARLKSAFAAEASSRDQRQRLFGAEASKGLGLFEMLSARYDVVCTNPPYMGSGNMCKVLKTYVGTAYKSGKADLFASFIMRCRSLTAREGSYAMVTQQSWMYLRSFQTLRESIMGEDAVEVVLSLGAGAFAEVSGEVVNVALFIVRPDALVSGHKMTGLRIKGPELRRAAAAGEAGAMLRAGQNIVAQDSLLEIEESPLVVWVPNEALRCFTVHPSLGSVAHVTHGLTTTNNGRFVRFIWEVPEAAQADWTVYVKGESAKRWLGSRNCVVRWGRDGNMIKRATLDRYAYLTGNSPWVLQGKECYFKKGVTYSTVAMGKLAGRDLRDAIFDVGSAGVFLNADCNSLDLLAYLNTRVANLLIRALCPNINFRESYIERIPYPWIGTERRGRLSAVSEFAVECVRSRNQSDLVSDCFRKAQSPINASSRQSPSVLDCARESLLLSSEYWVEERVAGDLGMPASALSFAFRESGPPAAAGPLLEGYASLPAPRNISIAPPDCLRDSVASAFRLQLSDEDLELRKSRLRDLYVAGPGAEIGDEAVGDGADEEVTLGAHISLSPETFLEELSQRLEIHPISVYWLLEELREKEGLVCAPETKRETEDWLSEQALRMLGHRWPLHDQYQQEEGQPFLAPDWVDADGLIALTSDMGEETLSERYRRFLDAEVGSDDGHEVEVKLAQTLGWKLGTEWGKQKPLSLGDWLKRDFFRRHVSQFKRRPIAWHLKSPKGSVQLIVYCHAFNRDRLALLRARYLGNLRQELSGKLAAATVKGYGERANLARIDELDERLADLKAFDDKLARLQEGREREARIWCPWKTPEEQPRGWDPDINDGVRVNIAPLQRLGLLAADVLNKKDLNSLLAPEGRG